MDVGNIKEICGSSVIVGGGHFIRSAYWCTLYDNDVIMYVCECNYSWGNFIGGLEGEIRTMCLYVSMEETSRSQVKNIGGRGNKKS